MSLTPEHDLTGATLNAGWEVSKAILKGFVGIEKSESEEPSYYDLAYEALNKGDYEQALEYAKEGQEEFSKFEYYRLCGLCHYCMRQDLLEQCGEKADLLGLEEDTDDEDPRWRKIQSILDEAEKQISNGDYGTIVFLGDLVDDWNQWASISLYNETFDALVDFIIKHPKLLYCYGYHDISYEWEMLETGYFEAA